MKTLSELWLWAFVETIKCILFCYGVMGYFPKKGKKKYAVFLYLFLGIAFIGKDSLWEIYYCTFWFFLFICLFLEGRLQEKIRLFIIEYLFVNITDTWILAVFMNTVLTDMSEIPAIWKNVGNSLGILLWLFLALCLRKKRKQIRDYLRDLPVGYFLILIGLFLAMIIMVVSMQGVLYGKFTERMQKAAFLAGITSMFYIVGACCILVHLYNVKQRSELVNLHIQESLEHQKKYYEARLEQDERIRQFRHDFKKHMQALAVLCREQRMEDAVEYIQQLTEVYQETQAVQTGNAIADYFIHAAITELAQAEGFEYQIFGRFPGAMLMEQGDFCILLSNAMENAKEALIRVEGKRELKIYIKNLEQKIFLTIANTAPPEEKEFFQTWKEEKELHGYGTRNMRMIVEKYGGMIEWKQEHGMCLVKIYLEVGEN